MTSKGTEFHIERSISIAASDADVFEFISNLRQWEQWNPTLRGADTMQRSYSGATRGAGAVAAWHCPRSGAGRMQITSATPSSQILVTVDFERPFKVQNRNTFELKSAGPSTVVTWSMRGPKPFLAKLMGLVINLDKALAKHFDAGLAQLKAAVESAAPRTGA